jgi:hypothetical protein
MIYDELSPTLQPDASSNSMIVADVQIAVANASYGFERVPKALRNLLEQAAWRRFELPDVSALPEEGDAADTEIEYGSDEFEIFCTAPLPSGLDISVERLMHLTAAIGGEDAEVALQMVRELLTPLEPHGGQRDAAPSKVVSQPCPSRGAAYQVRRLKRDNPEVAAEVVAGKLSANAAAERAGLRQKYLRIPANPWFAAEKLRAQGTEWITEFARALGPLLADKRRDRELVEECLAEGGAELVRRQIELELTDRNHEPAVSLQLAGEWLAPPGDPLFVPSPGAELPENASLSVARLKNGAFLAYVRVPRGGDACSTMALLFGDPAELPPQNLSIDLVNTIQALVRECSSVKSSCP